MFLFSRKAFYFPFKHPFFSDMKSITSYISTLLRVSLLCLVAGAFVACDDDPLPMRPTLPANGRSNVHRVTHVGERITAYDWSFSYLNGRLVQATGELRDPSAQIDRSYRYTSSLKYGAHSVTIKNSTGDQVRLTLNPKGYIQTMNVGRDIYNFVYGADDRLIGWHKIIFENNFGQAQQYKSSATIEYENGNLSKIDYVDNNSRPVTLNFIADDRHNFNGILPPAVTKEMGCLGFEHLYYAGLLGRPTEKLVKRVTYSSDDPAQAYFIDFEYNLDENGNVQLCSYHTKNGGLASINYLYQ